MEIKKLDNRGSWRRGKTFHNFTHCESCGGLMDEIHNRMMIHIRDKKITNILCE